MLLLPRQITGQSKQSITGQLILLDDTPGANCRVILIKPWTNDTLDSDGSAAEIIPLRFTVTDSEGNYTFENVPPGIYNIAAEQEPIDVADDDTEIYVYTTDWKVTQTGVFLNQPQVGMIVAVIVPTLENERPYAFNGTPRLLVTGPDFNYPTGKQAILECEMMDYPEIEGTNWQLYRDGGYQVIKQVKIINPGYGYTYSPENPDPYEVNGTAVYFANGGDVKQIVIDSEGSVSEINIPTSPPFAVPVIAKNITQYQQYIREMEATGSISVPDEAFY